MGSEYVGLFHVAYVSGTRNDSKLGVGDGLAEPFGDGDRAALVRLTPKEQRRDMDRRQERRRIVLGERSRHQTEPERMEVGDDGRHRRGHVARHSLREELHGHPTGHELRRSQLAFRETSGQPLL